MPRKKQQPEPEIETNLLGETPGVEKLTGTSYCVMEHAEMLDPKSHNVRAVWRERGTARAANPRSAITEVVGEDRAGAYRAIPESSMRIHVRREERRLTWDELGPEVDREALIAELRELAASPASAISQNESGAFGVHDGVDAGEMVSTPAEVGVTISYGEDVAIAGTIVGDGSQVLGSGAPALVPVPDDDSIRVVDHGDSHEIALAARDETSPNVLLKEVPQDVALSEERSALDLLNDDEPKGEPDDDGDPDFDWAA